MQMNKDKWLQSAELMRSFSNVQKNIIAIIQQNAAENGISVTQYSILMTILPYGEITQKQLAKQMYIPKSTLSQSVEKLVQHGYLKRKQVEDNRRETLLKLSVEGEAFFCKIHMGAGGIHEMVQAAITTLGSKQYQDLLAAHQQIAVNLEALRKESGDGI